MSTSRIQHPKTNLNITLINYVDLVKQQMQQSADLSATSGKITQPQARLEQVISRQLAKSL